MDFFGTKSSGQTIKELLNKSANKTHPGGPARRGRSNYRNNRTSTGTASAATNNNLTDELPDDITINAKRIGAIRTLQFPADLEEMYPYIMFKAYETDTSGNSPISEDTSASLRSGVGVVSSAAAGVPAGTAALAAILGGQAAGGVGAIIAGGLTTDTGAAVTNTTANAIFGGIEGGISSRAKDILKSFNLKRNNTRIESAICLFMPDGITTNYDNEYETLSVTATTGFMGFAAQALSAKQGVVTDVNPYIAEATAAVASKIVGNEDFAKLGLFATTGLVVNPQLETIYSSPVLRKFVFDFRLVPRDDVESKLIQEIIREFKYRSSPTIKDGTGGRFLIPPAQFEIEFYDGKNDQNLYLFKTKKCVLTGISLDYTPNGYATFYDGAPVETRMQLTFQETVIIDRKAVDAGY